MTTSRTGPPDGRSVVYACDLNGAIELWLLDLDSGTRVQLTHDQAVAVEPRFSPDGHRLVFVSTAFNRRFHIFTAQLAGGRLEQVARLTGEPQPTAALLLQPLRPRDKPGLGTRWQVHPLHLKPRPHPRHGRVLAHRT